MKNKRIISIILTLIVGIFATVDLSSSVSPANAASSSSQCRTMQSQYTAVKSKFYSAVRARKVAYSKYSRSKTPINFAAFRNKQELEAAAAIAKNELLRKGIDAGCLLH